MAITASAHNPPAGEPTTTHNIQPVFVAGNPTECAGITGFQESFRINQPADGTFTDPNFPSFSITLTEPSEVPPLGGAHHGDETFDFVASGGSVKGMIVKGGPDANRYIWPGSGVTADTYLHAPINASNDRYYGLSHIDVCYNVRTQLQIVKTAVDDEITIGEAPQFDITVTNIGTVTAINVDIDDTLPTVGSPWTDNKAECTVTGGVTLHCDIASLAPAASFTVRVTGTAMTADDCGELLDNTAFADADNADEVNDDAEIDVVCAAIRILKNSTKGGAVSNAGAVFSVEGPSPSLTTFNVTDDTTAAAPDEDADIGEVCVGDLAVGSYTVNEVTPPAGYGDASEADIVVVAAAGTNCSTNLPSGTGVATFTNPPLLDIIAAFRDAGSGEVTIVSIVCTGAGVNNNTLDGTPLTGWDASQINTDIEFVDSGDGTMTLSCDIKVDP
jgi:uncharacterized repeat protein (TIGR01451 family)